MADRKNLAGQTFGHWTVLNLAEANTDGRRFWLCRCVCGTERKIRRSKLEQGITKSCGCIGQSLAGTARRIDLTGQRFGAWTVLSYAGMNDYNHSSWDCRCDCGVLRRVAAQPLRTGRTISCGCLKAETTSNKQTKTGEFVHKWTPEYRAWMSMRGRCSPDNKAMAPLYADRGIGICEQWAAFDCFLRDMGPVPGPGMTLDRIDNDRGYDPSNCRWADCLQQSQNRRTSRRRPWPVPKPVYPLMSTVVVCAA